MVRQMSRHTLPTSNETRRAEAGILSSNWSNIEKIFVFLETLSARKIVRFTFVKKRSPAREKSKRAGKNEF